ncbi:galectin-8-like isoform X2 [Latimeria chalumnae]|uniref:galectin-8-like isoform X2 n=1 Tax=Latimeria chalumnae TaxID=7897 RepID=UPI00313B9EFC
MSEVPESKLKMTQGLKVKVAAGFQTKQHYKINFTGEVPTNANSFSLFLKPNEEDVALNVEVIYDDETVPGNKVIKCSSCTAGKWSTKQLFFDFQQFPIPQGSTFEVTIHIRRDIFEVLKNGSTICQYNHRLPFSSLSAVGFAGDVIAQSVTFTTGCCEQQPAVSLPEVQKTAVQPPSAQMFGGAGLGAGFSQRW